MVARFVRDEEAVGSNPATPTNVSGRLGCAGLLTEGEDSSKSTALATNVDHEVLPAIGACAPL